MTLEESVDEASQQSAGPGGEGAHADSRSHSRWRNHISALAADARLQVPRISPIFQSVIVSQERGASATLMGRSFESTRENPTRRGTRVGERLA
jgi:hypothetical protein